MFTNNHVTRRLSENPQILVGVLEAGGKNDNDPLIDTPRTSLTIDVHLQPHGARRQSSWAVLPETQSTTGNLLLCLKSMLWVGRSAFHGSYTLFI